MPLLWMRGAGALAHHTARVCAVIGHMAERYMAPGCPHIAPERHQALGRPPRSLCVRYRGSAPADTRAWRQGKDMGGGAEGKGQQRLTYRKCSFEALLESRDVL